MNLSEGAIEVRAGLNKHVLCGILFDIKLIQELRNETRSLVLSKANSDSEWLSFVCVKNTIFHFILSALGIKPRIQ